MDIKEANEVLSLYYENYVGKHFPEQSRNGIAIRTILAYHAKQNAEAEKWIPIRTADDLPKENGYYLATCGSVGIDPADATSHELNWFDNNWYLPTDEMIKMTGVIAWMEKPKPYLDKQAEGGEE